MRPSRYRSVSRCSVKMTSFCFVDGGRSGNLAVALRNLRLRDGPGSSSRREDCAEQGCQLSPFGVGAAPPYSERKSFQFLERLDLGLQLDDRSRCRRPVENCLLGCLDFVLGGLVQVLDILGIEVRSRGGKCDGRPATALQHLELTQAALQTLTAAAQRLMDGLRRGSEPALQDRQGKADGAGSLVVLERRRTVEFLAHVGGDDLVKVGFRIGELVGDRVRNTFREQRRAVALEQLLFHHAAHQVRDIGGMNAVAKAPLEPVTVDERHEELKVFLFPVVRGGRHQQEMAGETR